MVLSDIDECINCKTRDEHFIKNENKKFLKNY